MINKGKITLIIGLVLVVVGVWGALTLVQRNQDLRKSATVDKTTIRLSPTVIAGTVDNTVTVGVFIDTPRKVSTAKVKLCYGDALTTDVNSITNVGPLTVENYKKIENNCLIISKRVETSVTVDQLPTGSFQFASVSFKIKNNGNLTISQVDSLVAGDPVGGDVNIPIDEVVGATVTVGGGSVGGGSMTFESGDFMTKKVNESLVVKLYLNTTKNFDAAEVKFCYGDKLLLVDSGIIKGVDFTDVAKKTINNNCLEYAVLATSKSLTGKVLLGTFNFKAVNSGSGTLLFDSVVKNYSNAVDGLMKAENTPSASYIIASASSVCTPNCSCASTTLIGQTCSNGCSGTCAGTKIPTTVCTSGVKECVSTSQSRECVNNAWVVSNCNSVQLCNSASGVCEAKTTVGAVVNIKMAFAGVKSGNDQCAVSWPVALRVVNKEGGNALATAEFNGIPQKTTSTNSKGETIYNFSTTVSNVPTTGINNLSFFIKGPEHLSLKYGVNGQTSWYKSLAGQLGLVVGTNVYDFSNYSLLAGDVTGDTVGVPDGKIDGRDFSFIKEKANSATVVQGDAGTNVSGDIDGNCQVNSGDVRLVKESLVEINGQTY